MSPGDGLFIIIVMSSKANTLTYSEKLRDPRWQKMRLKIMERDKFACRKCFSERETLNVHHKEYRYGCEPWEYPAELLITLCEPCHKGEHRMEAQSTQRAARAKVPTGSDVWGWQSNRPAMLLKLAQWQEAVRSMVEAGAMREYVSQVENIVAQMEIERDTIAEQAPVSLEHYLNDSEPTTEQMLARLAELEASCTK